MSAVHDDDTGLKDDTRSGSMREEEFDDVTEHTSRDREEAKMRGAGKDNGDKVS